MRKIFIFILLLASIHSASAQQDAMFSRYMFNTMYLFQNPAYSGSHGYWTSNALYRTQWLSFDGAPTTIYAGGEGLIGRKQRAGLGFSFFHDKIGLDRMTDLSVNYAYHIQLSKEQHLSLGIKAGAFAYKSLLSNAVIWNPSDPVYGGDISGLIPRAGLGIYWYGRDFFAGLSVPTLIALDKRSNSVFSSGNSSVLQQHFYGYGGYVFHLENDIDLKPSILLKYQPAAPLQADFNLNVWFKKLFSVGMSYRTNDAISVMVEIPINQKLSVGYAFDNTITDIRQVSSGTHELMVGYNFISNRPSDNPLKYRSIKRF